MDEPSIGSVDQMRLVTAPIGAPLVGRVVEFSMANELVDREGRDQWFRKPLLYPLSYEGGRGRGYRSGRAYPYLGVLVGPQMDVGVEHERAQTMDRTRSPSAEIEYRSVSLRAHPYRRVPLHLAPSGAHTQGHGLGSRLRMRRQADT
jgi:hypothetical protein